MPLEQMRGPEFFLGGDFNGDGKLDFVVGEGLAAAANHITKFIRTGCGP